MTVAIVRDFEYKSLPSGALSKRVSGHVIPLTQKSPPPFIETQQIRDIVMIYSRQRPYRTRAFV
jgi:hypothetical protein